MANLMHNSFSVCLFPFSTCFEQPRAHHQENQLYEYNMLYVSLCAGDCFMCTPNGNLHRVYQMLY
jgi:hypothetical protein